MQKVNFFDCASVLRFAIIGTGTVCPAWLGGLK